jgi:hypothetical protein
MILKICPKCRETMNEFDFCSNCNTLPEKKEFKPEFKPISPNLICETLSKDKHVIFIHDVEGILYDFTNQKKWIKKVFKEVNKKDFEIYSEIIQEADHLYMIEFPTYEEAKSFFNKHYFPDEETRLMYKEKSIVITIYSNGEHVEDNL